MNKEVLDLHNEEITNIKYVFYKLDLTFEEIQDELNNILYNSNEISCTYLYVETKCSFYVFIPHASGETILAIQIKRVTNHLDPNVINERQPIFYESMINSKYCIEIIRHKGIKDYKIIRDWLIKQLEAYGWIKEKQTKLIRTNLNQHVDTISAKILAL